MRLQEALTIVIDLAEDGVLEDRHVRGAPELEEEQSRQRLALRLVRRAAQRLQEREAGPSEGAENG